MQLGLFDKPTTTDKWAMKAELWMQSNPRAVEIFCEYALHQSFDGTKKVGAKDIAEQMRWHGELVTLPFGDPFKINNNYITYLAHKAVQRHPQLEKAFKFKKRTA